MFSAGLVLAATLTPGKAETKPVKFNENSILIYSNVSETGETQFVLRLARFSPDIVFEWESVSYQGTVHLRKKAFEEGKGLTLSKLFDPGVDSESKDDMTKWLSKALYDDLVNAGKAKVRLNRISTEFRFDRKITRPLRVDKKEVSVPAILVEDKRDGRWVFQDDRENPVLLEFSNSYYREFLKSVVTNQPGSLRWIRELPPVK